ncbi:MULTISPECIES: type II toxin-antitoxin system VapC family toxin [Sphingomonas]|uniref:type II toxin-antitoxin system VapC family toxin n=1 Tax=Sphingomonas TaxID=13687 RepID=UPI001F4DEF83|nr:type II toxin-antitoxin system VapC family toxin [Sphingomonas turrisvirgatae]
MTIDLRSHLRRIKSEKTIRQFSRRPEDELVAAADLAGEGRAAIMADTNVYIRSAAGTLPAAAEALVERGLLFHCTVCVAELSTGVANADPEHSGWKTLRDHYAGLIASIPATRLLTPDPEIWVEAGLIAGTLARIQNYQRHQRKEALNDALIFLTAAKAGLPVLTSNRDEFDLIQQLAPGGRFIHF